MQLSIEFGQQMLVCSIDVYRNIPEIITKIKGDDLTLQQQQDHLETAGIEFSSRGIANAKFSKVVSNNLCLKQLKDTMYNNIDFLTKMKYAPSTSVACERSFSQHKTCLRPNRMSFTADHVKYHCIINYNCFL